jgi:pSer/pThr/pTyr-binding forkhead associated (FHA) protein
MIELHVCDRKGELLRAFAIGDTAEIVIGRDKTCDVQIKSKQVSREHCAIERGPDGAMVLRDLGSTFGTLVGGQPVEEVPVHDGLEVGIGPAVLKFYDARI